MDFQKMLHYTEVHLSSLEVPGENSLCIYISGCLNHCLHCHYPELQKPDHGDSLLPYYMAILELYSTQATCICFLGEGENTPSIHSEFSHYCHIAAEQGFRTRLYCGRNVKPEPWMACFDYVKVGSFKEEKGPLSSPSTNQRMYRKINGKYQDITHLFWKD